VVARRPNAGHPTSRHHSNGAPGTVGNIAAARRNITGSVQSLLAGKTAGEPDAQQRLEHLLHRGVQGSQHPIELITIQSVIG